MLTLKRIFYKPIWKRCCFCVRFQPNIDEPLVQIVLSDLSSSFDGPSNVTSLHVNFDGPSALRVNRPLNVYKYEICKTKKKQKTKKKKKTPINQKQKTRV